MRLKGFLRVNVFNVFALMFFAVMNFEAIFSYKIVL